MNFSLELFVSILALGVSVYALYRGWKNEQLSRVPHLDWNQGKHRSKDGTVFRMTLRNTGLGPAIVEDRWFLLEGKRFEAKTGDAAEELAGICLNGVPHVLRRHDSPGVGSVMPVGETLCIAELFFPGLKTEQEPEVLRCLARADFEVDYRSLHGQRFRFTTKDREPQG